MKRSPSHRMFFAPQFDIERSLSNCEPSLRHHVQALVASEDWSELDLETQAIGLLLGFERETRQWLESLACSEPVGALDLVLRASRYTFAIRRSATGFHRSLSRAPVPAATSLATAEFWRELRRASWDSRLLQTELSRVAAPIRDSARPLRAGIGFLLPHEKHWWTEDDDREALRVADKETGSLLLLALSRNELHTLRHIVWPPPASVLRGLTPDMLATARSWCPPTPVAPRPERPLARQAAELLRREPSTDAFALLAQLRPDAAELERIKAAPRCPSHAAEFIRQVMTQVWETELHSPAPTLALEKSDGSSWRDGWDMARLRGALRSEDAGTIEWFRGRASPNSLSAFTNELLVRWLLEGAHEEGEWTLRALRYFPSDLAAEALSELATGGGLNVYRLIDALGAMRTRSAMQALFMLVHRDPGTSVSTAARQYVAEAARDANTPLNDFEDALFPAVELPPDCSVVLGLSGKPSLRRDDADRPWPSSATAALQALPGMLARLDARMALGHPMPASVFTETWGQNPILRAVASGIVWGIFRNAQLVGWFIPSLTKPPLLLDADGIRPLHALEMTKAERTEVLDLLAGDQPIPQLRRRVFIIEAQGELRFSMVGLENEEGNLRKAGWTPVDGQGVWRRQQDEWTAELRLTGVHPFLGRLFVTGAASPRVYSELFSQLSAVANSTWTRGA